MTSSVTQIASYQWDAPGATPANSAAGNPSFAYGAIGNYNINVTVTTADGSYRPGDQYGRRWRSRNKALPHRTSQSPTLRAIP